MPIIKEKTIKKVLPKLSKKNIVKESEYAKIKREGREQREAAAAKKINDKLDKIAEVNRLEKIVLPYLDKLDKKLKDKKTNYFWIFPDRTGFKKIIDTSLDRMEKLLILDIPKCSYDTHI